METKTLSRSYLETLSSADLVALADDYGIDVPDDLNRRFLIGELLEVAEEAGIKKSDDIGIVAGGFAPFANKLPDSYNETQINVVLRNPVWAFVYWDIREADSIRLSSDSDFSTLLLRTSFFSDEAAVVPEESFDVQVSLADREQYVLLRAGKKIVRIDLIAVFQDKTEEKLSVSRKVVLPSGSELLSTGLPGREINVTPLQELSSLRELLRTQYENHRQSFLE
ncbi:MAG: DUF4912 domain-containing protein [Treponema sp.]|nr:DUF4912 domain-containing protein [Treponema sp.]